jgi:hypothetical protein
LEPISPELVLVDPELGRAERARLRASAKLQVLTDVETVRPQVEPALTAQPPALQVRALEAQVRVLEAHVRALEGQVEALELQLPQPPIGGWRHALEWPRKRLAPMLLPISLIANAILIAVAVAETRVESTSVPVDTTAQRQAVPLVPSTSSRKTSHPRSRKTSHPRSHAATKSRVTSKRSSRTHGSRTRRRRAVVRVTAGAVERKVLGVVIQSPAGKLPPSLIDRNTGLAKNGLQAVCRRSGARSFVCVVRPTQHKPAEGLYVRYRLGRTGPSAYTWYRYRSG